MFLIHDWDLSDINADIVLDKADAKSPYESLSTVDKIHWTKNHKITADWGNTIHWNKKHLEDVLGITNKGTVEIAQKLTSKSIAEINNDYPSFTSKDLLDFMECN